MEHEKLGISSPDKGPWHAQEWPDGRIVLQSDDFEHDVALVVTGDFDGDKMHGGALVFHAFEVDDKNG